MKNKIFKSTCLVGVVTLLCSLVLIMGVLYEYFTSVQLKQLEVDSEFVASAVEKEGLDYLNSLDNTNCRVTWISSDGEVLFDNTASASKMENHLEREEVKQAIENGVGSSIRYSSTVLYKSLYSARLLKDGSIIRTSISQSSIWAIAISMIQPLLIVVLITIGLSFYLAYRISNKVVEPLNEIDLDHPENCETYEEIKPLINRLTVQQRLLHNQEKELSDKKNEFNAATKNLNEGLVLLNDEGIILSINDFASSLLNITTYCVGKDLLLFNNSVEMQELLNKAKSGNKNEVIIPINNINYEFYASPIISNNKVNGISLLIIDISEKEKTEIMRKEFTANVSHELKTPLQNISGCAELLSNGMVSNKEDVTKFSKQIYKESKRLMSLIEDIIKLSYLDEDNDEGADYKQIDLYEACNSVINDLSLVASNSKVSLSVEGDHSAICTSPKLLHMIIYNLVDNGIKYNKENGYVKIDIVDESDKSIIKIKDNGIGIPSDSIDRIFERFYRVDKSRSKEVGGTGLGLSIVKHAVKTLNGDITVSSLPGSGSEFTITLPKL